MKIIDILCFIAIMLLITIVLAVFIHLYYKLDHILETSKCPKCKKRNTKLLEKNHTNIHNCIDKYKCLDCNNVYSEKYDGDSISPIDYM